MTNEIQAENILSIPELSAEFAASYGLTIGQLTIEKLNLKKQNEALLSRNASLESERPKLIEAHIALEDQVHSLQKELEARPTLEDVEKLKAEITRLIEAGPTLEQSAQRGMERTAARKGRTEDLAQLEVDK